MNMTGRTEQFIGEAEALWASNDGKDSIRFQVKGGKIYDPREVQMFVDQETGATETNMIGETEPFIVTLTVTGFAYETILGHVFVGSDRPEILTLTMESGDIVVFPSALLIKDDICYDPLDENIGLRTVDIRFKTAKPKELPKEGGHL